MKRYSMRYESDEIVCQSNDRVYGMASTIGAAKGYIRKCKKSKAQYNPRNFRIYDHWEDIDPKTNCVPCVYREA